MLLFYAHLIQERNHFFHFPEVITERPKGSVLTLSVNEPIKVNSPVTMAERVCDGHAKAAALLHE
ncbi:MAG TPA: hypothetical protein VK737_01730 [Opitutales bacterium]|jgi:hypothetical protein|nr:hypothetical protein [Opitutales bacterium]